METNPRAYNLNLTPDELRVVSDALVQMPYIQVVALIGKRQDQVNAQQAQSVEKPQSV